MRKLLFIFILVLLPINHIFAEEIEKAQLTYGAMKKHLVKNETNQTEIIKLFGSPNNMTMTSDGEEVWIYDSISTETSVDTESGSKGIGLGLGGGGGGFLGGIFAGGRKDTSGLDSTSSTKSLTIILEFNKDGVLKDYTARVGRY